VSECACIAGSAGSFAEIDTVSASHGRRFVWTSLVTGSCPPLISREIRVILFPYPLMKSFLLVCSLFTLAIPANAGTPKVSIQVQIHSERQDKERGSPDQSRAYNLIVRVTNPTSQPMEGLALKWALYADSLQRGTDEIILEKAGEQTFNVEPRAGLRMSARPRWSLAGLPSTRSAPAAADVCSSKRWTKPAIVIMDTQFRCCKMAR